MPEMVGQILGINEPVDLHRVRHSVDAATLKIQSVKSSASGANLPMPSQLEARLRSHLRVRGGKGDLLFVNRNGRPFSANKLREKQLDPVSSKVGNSAG